MYLRLLFSIRAFDFELEVGNGQIWVDGDLILDNQPTFNYDRHFEWLKSAYSIPNNYQHYLWYDIDGF